MAFRDLGGARGILNHHFRFALAGIDCFIIRPFWALRNCPASHPFNSFYPLFFYTVSPFRSCVFEEPFASLRMSLVTPYFIHGRCFDEILLHHSCLFVLFFPSCIAIFSFFCSHWLRTLLLSTFLFPPASGSFRPSSSSYVGYLVPNRACSKLSKLRKAVSPAFSEDLRPFIPF